MLRWIQLQIRWTWLICSIRWMDMFCWIRLMNMLDMIGMLDTLNMCWIAGCHALIRWYDTECNALYTAVSKTWCWYDTGSMFCWFTYSMMWGFAVLLKCSFDMILMWGFADLLSDWFSTEGFKDTMCGLKVRSYETVQIRICILFCFV